MHQLLHLLLQLVRSKDGSLSTSKLGYLTFWFVFSWKMGHDLPDDPWLWFVYGATVGGVQLAQKLIAAKFAPSPDATAGNDTEPEKPQ